MKFRNLYGKTEKLNKKSYFVFMVRHIPRNDLMSGLSAMSIHIYKFTDL